VSGAKCPRNPTSEFQLECATGGFWCSPWRLTPDTGHLSFHSGQNTLSVTANEKVGQFRFRALIEGSECDNLADKNGIIVRFLMT
jgi:hypothetical protein